MHHYLLGIPDSQFEKLRSLSERSEEPMSAWVRRFIEYGLEEHHLNEMVPYMSGKLQLNKQ